MVDYPCHNDNKHVKLNVAPLSTASMQPLGVGRDLPPTLDDEWLGRLRDRLKERGARTQLASALGVERSTITRLASGERAAGWLVLAVSHHFGMLPPRSYFTERQAAWLEILSRAEAELAPESVEGLTKRLRTLVERTIEAAQEFDTGASDGGVTPLHRSRRG